MIPLLMLFALVDEDNDLDCLFDDFDYSRYTVKDNSYDNYKRRNKRGNDDVYGRRKTTYKEWRDIDLTPKNI